MNDEPLEYSHVPLKIVAEYVCITKSHYAELSALRAENERLKARVIEVDGYYDKTHEDSRAEKQARETAEAESKGLKEAIALAIENLEAQRTVHPSCVNNALNHLQWALDDVVKAALGSRG